MPSTLNMITNPSARHLQAAHSTAWLQPQKPGNPTLRMLEDGQATVRGLLNRHALMAPQRGTALRAGVARRLCAEMAVHLQVEAALLYPRLRDVLDNSAALDQAEVEHECMRALMERLMVMDANEPLFDASVTVLGELFDLHLQRQALQVLPLLYSSGLDLHQLGTRMMRCRDDLLAEMADGHGPRFENEEADPVGQPPR